LGCDDGGGGGGEEVGAEAMMMKMMMMTESSLPSHGICECVCQKNCGAPRWHRKRTNTVQGRSRGPYQGFPSMQWTQPGGRKHDHLRTVNLGKKRLVKERDIGSHTTTPVDLQSSRDTTRMTSLSELSIRDSRESFTTTNKYIERYI
jgi:hypothetical protein